MCEMPSSTVWTLLCINVFTQVYQQVFGIVLVILCHMLTGRPMNYSSVSKVQTANKYTECEEKLEIGKKVKDKQKQQRKEGKKREGGEAYVTTNRASGVLMTTQICCISEIMHVRSMSTDSRLNVCAARATAINIVVLIVTL